MDARMTFLDCPAFLDQKGAARCGLPAVVEDHYRLGSTDGPVACVKIHCAAGHWFSGPVDALTMDADAPAADPAAAAAAVAARR
jgi:hypothetical protein